MRPEERKDLSAYPKQVPANKGMSQDGVFCMENGVFCITPLTIGGLDLSHVQRKSLLRW